VTAPSIYKLLMKTSNVVTVSVLISQHSSWSKQGRMWFV